MVLNEVNLMLGKERFRLISLTLMEETFTTLLFNVRHLKQHFIHPLVVMTRREKKTQFCLKKETSHLVRLRKQDVA